MRPVLYIILEIDAEDGVMCVQYISQNRSVVKHLVASHSDFFFLFYFGIFSWMLLK